MVKIDPDEVYALGQETITFAKKHLEETEPLSKVTVDDATFGDFETATEFVLVHGTARDVVKETLKGVHDDLVNFGTGLKKAVETLREAEDDTVRAFGLFGGYVPGMPVDPQTDLDPTSLDDIAGIEDLGAADSRREDAINAAQDGGDSA